MLERDKKEILELLEMILDSIEVIQGRTRHIKTGNEMTYLFYTKLC